MYAFDEYELDTQRYQLRRRGQVVPLEPKVFDVLRYLVEHHDRVATKREMLDALWPGEVVTEAVLPTNINAVRRALGQQRGAKTPIETVHGRGYRFTAKVSVKGQRPGRSSGVLEKAPDSAVIALADSDHEPFIGRRGAMARLLAGLERGLSGEGQLWVLTGEAGIGKSRTAAQLATVALSRGATVWSGQCLDAEGAPAFWPWVQVLREALRGESEGALCDYLGSALPDIAELVPEAAQLSEAPLSQPHLTGEQARFRLFDAVARFLARASDARPRLVVLEDLHWADAPSLHLLKFVACAVPASSLVILVTVREEDLAYDAELRRFVDSLARLRGINRLTLDGLSEGEIGRYVESISGEAPDPAVARAIQRRTGGNPLFVREMMRLVEGKGAPNLGDVEAWERQLPQAAVDAVRGRLERLPTDVRQLLEIASVIGVDFELPLLEHLLGLEPEPLLAAIDTALAHRLVLQRSDRISGYAFTHALIRDALYSGLSVAQRARVHARIARALEDRVLTGGADMLFELAHHAYRGLPETDAERAVAFTCRAAGMAERVHAYEDAVGWYRRALDALPFVSSPSVEQACQLELSLARALQAMGQYQEARRHAADVFERAASENLDVLVVEAALTLSPVDTLRSPADPAALDALQDALVRVGEHDRAARARLLSRLSHTSRYVHDAPARVKLTETALATAEGAGDPDAELEALHARLSSLNHPETLDEALALSDRLAARAASARRPAVSLGVHAFRFQAYLQLGDLARADEENGEMLYIAHETRDVLHTWHAERHRALRALCDGDFERAEHMLGALAPVGAELHGRLAELYSGTARVWLLRDKGELEAETRARRDQLRPGFAQAGGAFRVQGLLLDAELGQTASARRGFDELAAEAFEPVLHGPDHVSALAYLAEVCVVLADRDHARALYDMLLPYAELNAVDALGHYIGSVRYFLGRLAQLLGNLSDGREHLELAVEHNAALGMRPQLCRTRWALARLLLSTGRGADRERAERLASTVERDASALGMRGLLLLIQGRREASRAR